MKILGISASPRRNGNSEILLDKALEGARFCGAKTQKVILNEMRIKQCQGCARCSKDGICFIRDDMQCLYKKLAGVDGIIVTSPIYFGSVTAQLKTMIDRCQSIWVRNFILRRKRHCRGCDKKGIFICVSGHRRQRFFKNSKDMVNIFFMVSGIKLFKELYVPNLEYKGEILKKKIALKMAFSYGMDLVNACR